MCWASWYVVNLAVLLELFVVFGSLVKSDCSLNVGWNTVMWVRQSQFSSDIVLRDSLYRICLDGLHNQDIVIM